MKRSQVRNVIHLVGMAMILVGIIWACYQITPFHSANAANNGKRTNVASSKQVANRTQNAQGIAKLRQLTNRAKQTGTANDSPTPLTEVPVSEKVAQAEPTVDPLPIPEALPVEKTGENNDYVLSMELPETEPDPAPNAIPVSPIDNATEADPLPSLDDDPLLFNPSESSEMRPEPLPATTDPTPSSNSADASPNPSIPSTPTTGESSLPSLRTISTQTSRPGDATLFGPQKADVTITKEMPAEIQVGQTAVFKIIVKNNGKGYARDVTLRDTLPDGTRWVESIPSIEPAMNGELTWSSIDLAPGEEKVFEYHLIPETEGEIGSVATLFFATEASGKTVCTRPMIRLEVNAPEESLIGEKIKLDISISNPGTGTATNVTLLENVPDGLSHQSGRTLNNVIGDIEPGETKKISLTLTGEAAGVITNLMKVTADAGLSDEVATEIKINAPELALEINGAKNRYLERNATYQLKIWNPGTASAKGVKLVAQLPKNMEFVKTNNEGIYQESSHSVYWELVELPENIAPGEIELVLRPKYAGDDRLVFHGEGDHGLTASTEQEVSVTGMSSLTYRVTAQTDSVEAGQEAVYEILLSNRGTKETTNVNLQIQLPEGMDAVEADGPTRYQLQAGGISFLPLSRIAPKEEVLYKLKTRCNTPGDQRIRVEVSSDDMVPLAKEESVRVY